MPRLLAPLALIALVAAACGPSSTSVPQNDAAAQDRASQHDVALDTEVQEDAAPDAPAGDAPVQHDAVQHDTAVQLDAGPATLYPDIRALQQDPGYTGTLATVGSRVRLENVVVSAAKSTASTVFFIQNTSGPKEYSGIAVQSNSTVIPTMPAQGDMVTAIEGTLVEQVRSCNVDSSVCPTRHAITAVTLFTTSGTGTVPDPLAIATTDLTGTPAKYDGVLVQLTDSPLTVTATSGAVPSLTITVATNVAFYTYYYAPPGTPPNGTVIVPTTGIGVVDVYQTGWELYPRAITDLQFQDWPPDGGIQNDASPTTDAVVPGDAAPCGTDTVVISQIYGGGGNSGAPYKADFVELFNRGTNTVDLGAWSVQYGSTAGTTWSKANLTGKTIPPGGYLLVQMSAEGTNGVSLPTPDVTASPTIAMASDKAKVALVKTQTALTGACPTSTDIADLVGYGSGTNCSETAVGPSTSNTTSISRDGAGCQDYNNNSADFAAGAPAPRNSSTTAAPCGC